MEIILRGMGDNNTIGDVIKEINRQINEVNSRNYTKVKDYFEIEDIRNVIDSRDVANAIGKVFNAVVSIEKGSIVINCEVSTIGRLEHKEVFKVKLARKKMRVLYSKGFMSYYPQDKMVIVGVKAENADDMKKRVGDIRRKIAEITESRKQGVNAQLEEYARFLRSRNISASDLGKINQMLNTLTFSNKEKLMKML